MSQAPDTDREAQRQQLLLRTLWRDAAPDTLAPWCRDGGRLARGLQAYRANAGALAQRALAAAYPTLQQLVGDVSFASLARAFWHRHPPEHGDIATWGAALADFVGAAPSLADEPCLPDVARLEWAVHRAGSAADAAGLAVDLDRLLDTDASRLRLLARPGTAVVESDQPIVSIWRAHRPEQAHHADRFAAVRQALRQQAAEPALVWRQGWRVQVAALGPDDARFTAALLQGQALGPALESLPSAAGFDFSAWLVAALQRGWLAAAVACGDTPPDGGV